MTIRLVTDSTADIPLDQVRADGITVVPLTVFSATRLTLMESNWITRVFTVNCRQVRNCHVPLSPHQLHFKKHISILLMMELIPYSRSIFHRS